MNRRMSAGVLVLGVLCQTAIAEQPKAEPNLKYGSHCLFVALRALDFEVGSLNALEQELGPPGELGYSMSDLARTAESHGAHAMGVKTTIDDLTRRQERFACICPLEGGHFVCLYKVDDSFVHFIHPPDVKSVPIDTFNGQWNGKALLISNEPISEQVASTTPFILALTLAVAGLVALSLLIAWRYRRALVISSLLLSSLVFDGTESEIVMIVTAPEKRGIHRAKVHVETNAVDSRTVTIPWTMVVP